MDPNDHKTSARSSLLALRERLAGQSAACKLWTLGLAVLVLALVTGRPGSDSLLLAAAPLLLGGLADAAYVGRAGQITKLIQRVGSEPKLDSERAWKLILEDSSPQGLAVVLNLLRGLISLSVWPFYLALGLSVGLLGSLVLIPKTSSSLPQHRTTGQPGQALNPYANRPPGMTPFKPGGSIQAPAAKPIFPPRPKVSGFKAPNNAVPNPSVSTPSPPAKPAGPTAAAPSVRPGPAPVSAPAAKGGTPPGPSTSAPEPPPKSVDPNKEP